MALTKISGSILKDPLNLGEVSIGGTLTYQDVTNIDSVGVITARSGIRIGATGANTLISGTATGIGIGTNNPSTILYLRDDSNDCNLTVQATASGKDARINLYGHSGGVSQIRLGDEADANVGLITYDHSDNSLQLRAGDAERLRITSDGAVLLGITVASNAESFRIHTSDSGKAIIKLTNSTTGTGSGDGFEFGMNGNEQIEFVNKENTDMFFATNNTERLRIAADGLATFYGTNEQDLIYITTGNAAGNTFANIRGDNEAGIRIRGGGSYDGGTIELGGGLRNSDPGIIKFSTGTGSSVTERMRIDKDGYVTKPSNAIFHAFDGGSDISPNTDIVFGQERFDVGGGYNTSTGEYTAPATGYYHFYAQVYRARTHDDSSWGFFVDTGSGYSQISEARMENDYSGDSGRGYATLQSSIYWYMTAGHKMKCRVTSSGNIHCNTTYSYFCGNLVG